MKEEVKERIIKHLQFLKNEFADYSEYEKFTWKIYYGDKKRRREIERWIENLINSVIDIAKVIIAGEEYKIPETYREVIKSLGILKEFDEKIVSKLASYTKLRNVITHEYLDLTWNSIKKFIEEGKTLLDSFINSVEEYLKRKIK